MRCRIGPLSLTFTLILFVADEASAHLLKAEFRVLPGRRVQVESWFDITGDAPKGAKVEVFRADGQSLAQGTLDRNGIYVFAYEKAEPLRVVVTAGPQHAAELSIPEARLAEGDTLEPPAEPAPTAPVPMVDRTSSVTVKDVMVGVAFLLALAAFVLSVRNARQLRDLKRGMTNRSAADPGASLTAGTPRPEEPPTAPGLR